MITNKKNIPKLTTTILAAEEKFIKQKNAIKNATIEIIGVAIITFLNLVNTCIADNAGRIIIALINNEPIILIPTTTVIAVKIAKNILKCLVLIPVAFANSSSKTTTNILLYNQIKVIKISDATGIK